MINLTDVAKEQVKKLIEQEGKPGLFFRVGVKGGGCSGMTYDVHFDDKMNEGDRVFSINGVMVVCDQKSFVYLDNMTIDYSGGLVGAGFKFVNPNATGSCGCGTSFSA